MAALLPWVSEEECGRARQGTPGRGAVISVLFVQQTLPQASWCYLGTVDVRCTIQRDVVLP